MAQPYQLPDGRWRVRPAYKDIITDKWHQKTGTFATEAEALKFNRDFLHDVDQGFSPRNAPIGEYSEHWLKTYKMPYLKERSIKRIRQDFNHIFAYFGTDKQLASINKPLWQGFLNHVSKKYAKETNRLTNCDFRSMCEVAIDEGIILRNPTQNAHYSGIKPEYKYPRQLVLSLKDFKTVIAEIKRSKDSVGKYVCLVHAFTGMRFGEVCGLTWDKVNIFAKTIRVSEQYDYSTVKDLTALKGDSPERTIQVPDELIDALRHYKSWYADQVQRGNLIPNTKRFLFTTEKGYPISNSGINDYIHDICDRVGITRITTHGFRRTQATLMTLAENDLRSVASFLGHQDTKTTLKYYIKDIPELEAQAHRKMEQFYDDENIL
ncbi:tyrosine-type recombinase/integrase [Paucilactobacillus kaifaensis]|uniref:tyrosine-type recombinase/integrase n=1 Tax=Paucilactobacillus kaifaensis TaxID=2559921 RepID=UPI0010FA226F|nr:site-specific integrase [Paucilactobacillus kaifaensis]